MGPSWKNKGNPKTKKNKHTDPEVKFVPENVPEKTPGAWFTRLSMKAPGLCGCVEL